VLARGRPVASATRGKAALMNATRRKAAPM